MAQSTLTSQECTQLAEFIDELTKNKGTFVVMPEHGKVYAVKPNGHIGDFLQVAATYLGEGDGFRPEVGMYHAANRLFDGQFMLMRHDDFDLLTDQ